MTTTETTNTTATSPAALMELFAARAAAGDLAGLIELYESDAIFEPEFGATVVGHDQLRMALPEFLALHPQITYTTEPDVVCVGDIALVTNFWTMVGTAPDGSEVREGGTSADVCRRRPDGSWGVLIDQPRGVPAA
jgi:ketosteroid isomerase-like protein